MALELPFILGTSPEHAAITLYGFMQQNVLFDAFSGRLPDMAGTPLEFLQEITTLFSMIGLLVLIFSPSLWKPKYIVSWMFLFVLVALGGSSGNEFSYNLNKTEDLRFLSTGIEGDTTACQAEEMQNGACYKIHPNEEVMQRHVPQDTIGSALENREVFGQKKIIMTDAANPQLHVLAFLPQVYLIYATNRFKSNLETALYDLNTRRFNKKKQALQTMISAQTPVPQINLWLSIFDQVCASKAGVSTAALVTSGQTGVQNVLNSKLLSQNFKFGELVPVVAKSTILETYDNNLVPPSIDIVTKNRTKSGIMDITTKFLNLKHAKGFDDKVLADSQDAIRQYTINFPETAENGFFESIARAFGSSSSTASSSDQLVFYNDLNDDAASNSLKDHLANSILAKLENREIYENNGEAIKKHPISQTPADLIMPKYLISRTNISTHAANGSGSGGSANTSCYNLFNRETCSLEFMSRNTDNADLPNTSSTPSEPKSKFVRIPNCETFLTELEAYYRQAQQIDISDFENQLAAYTSQLAGNSPHSAYSIRIPSHVKAMSSYIKELNTMRLQCDSEAGNASGSAAGRSTPEWLACSERHIDPIVKHYTKSAINNALAQDKRNISNFYAEQYNSLTEGATGLAYSIGEGFTDLWTGPLAGLKSIGVGFQSGAYSHILPIIKNILIAFILVGTPILFLLGLLVPSWAPGVILTSIVSILFLQMTDVIMVVVQTILVAIEQPIYAIAQTTSDDATDYQAFMEVIWGMAYMSVFGITAFFMFAAGNTKQIMSQMAGLDGTVKSISKDIYTEGWKMTKQGVGMLAPGMGNTMISSTGAFNAITGTAAGLTNFATGNSASTAQEWSHAIQSKRISGMNENDNIKESVASTYDPTTKSQNSVMMTEHNKKRALKDAEYEKSSSEWMKDRMFEEDLASARDKRVISEDSYNKKIEKRAIKENRGFEEGQVDNKRSQDEASSMIESMADKYNIDKRLLSDQTITDPVTGVKTTSKGLLSQMKENLYRENLKAAGFKKGMSQEEAETARITASKMTVEMAGQVFQEIQKNGIDISNTKGKPREYTINSSMGSMAESISGKLKGNKKPFGLNDKQISVENVTKTLNSVFKAEGGTMTAKNLTEKSTFRNSAQAQSGPAGAGATAARSSSSAPAMSPKGGGNGSASSGTWSPSKGSSGIGGFGKKD
jgi:hypothetical protein